MRWLNGFRDPEYIVRPVAKLHPVLIGKDVTFERVEDKVFVTGPLRQFRRATKDELDPEQPRDIFVLVIGRVRFLASGDERVEVTLR